MRVQSFNNFTLPANTGVRSLPQASSQSLPQDKLTLVEPPPPGYNPSAPMPGGQYIIGGVAAIAVGAIGAYAGLHTGLGATLAGIGAGAAAGAVGLGTVGLLADLGGGFMSSSHKAGKAAAIGGALGGLAGGLVGAYAHSPIAAIALGGISAIASGLAATALANDALGS